MNVIFINFYYLSLFPQLYAPFNKRFHIQLKARALRAKSPRALIYNFRCTAPLGHALFI